MGEWPPLAIRYSEVLRNYLLGPDVLVDILNGFAMACALVSLVCCGMWVWEFRRR